MTHRDKHFPNDRELDDIKQLLGARTIHYQLGIDIDKSWAGVADPAVLSQIEKRMLDIFGSYAIRAASGNNDPTAYHSMYDTAMMRIWWEKFGDTVDVRRSVGNGEVGGRLGAVDGTDANTPTQLHEEGVQDSTTEGRGP